MNILNLIQAKLIEDGFDGLYNENGECACKHDDLEPCGHIESECYAGYLAPCDCGDHDWHIQAQKPSEEPKE